jgi:hypothetical protein
MIIPIEDCLLPPGYDKLAALTAKVSSKGGGPLTEDEKTLILSIVADVARCEWRDLDTGDPDDEGDGYLMQGLSGGKENDLVNALLYRARIGGSRWDLPMLNGKARSWNKRFAEGSWSYETIKGYFTGEIVEWRDVPYATKDDFLLEAVDFHCFPPIINMMLKKPQVKELLSSRIPFNQRGFLGSDMSDGALLETIMWTTRVSINYKRNVWETAAGVDQTVSWLWADKIPEQWWPVFEDINEQLKEELDNIARWYLSKQEAK